MKIEVKTRPQVIQISEKLRELPIVYENIVLSLNKSDGNYCDCIMMLEERYVIVETEIGFWVVPNYNPDRDWDETTKLVEDFIHGVKNGLQDKSDIVNLIQPSYYGAYFDNINEAIDIAIKWDKLENKRLIDKCYIKPIGNI